ncbi:MAG TPA: hypothetical protein VJY15_09240 [Candidatus Acidoferrum sp.]|nr:hypothetical protein [Candidatus Acidoferrum sp.]
MATIEPTEVYPEAAFQRAIVSVVKDILTDAGRPFVVLEGFGLDVATFLDNKVRFFEVKAFGGQRQGGVGFGNGVGEGIQVDLLLCDDKSLPLFDPAIRWVYADSTQSPGTARYALFTCTKAKDSAMANAVRRGKQNNLRISALRDSLVSWAEICAQIRRFLLD